MLAEKMRKRRKAKGNRYYREGISMRAETICRRGGERAVVG